MKTNLYEHKKEIVDRYKNNEPLKSIGVSYNASAEKIRVFLLKENIKVRSKAYSSANWKKGSSVQRSVALIESGDYNHLVEPTIRKHVKRFLIFKLGNKCRICGVSTCNDKPVPLVCDHIDGDSTNNNIDNFRLVCCNCDAQLPTFKSKNNGKGRLSDRKYYNTHKRKVGRAR